MIKIRDQEFQRSARLDYIMSNANPWDANHFDAETVIIDFKTGRNDGMKCQMAHGLIFLLAAVFLCDWLEDRRPQNPKNNNPKI
jgi:hypothetical protein